MNDSEQNARIVLRPLDRDLYPGFEKLLSRAWNQNWPDDSAQQIVRWRYYERPAGHVTWLACSGAECVAMLDSRVRPYRLYGETVMVRETADWFCLPEYRRFALGLQVLQHLKNYPEPVLVIGGSDHTLQILPRLRWHMVGAVRSYVLPITTRGLAGNLIRQKWPQRESFARIMSRRLPFRAPSRRPAPAGESSVQLLTRGDWYSLPANTTSDLVGLLDQAHWAWLAAMPPGFAQPIAAVFRLNDVIEGFALAQLEPTATGLDGRIVHVQVARSEVALIAWIFSATARLLADHGAEFIRCYVSTPEKIAAIRSVGFVCSRELPTHWWNRPGVRVPERIDVDYLRGDDAQPMAALQARHLGKMRPPRDGDPAVKRRAEPSITSPASSA